MLGTAGLPHILIRFYTVPTSRDARKSVLWAIGLIGVFYLFTLVLGFGAAALLDKGDMAEVAASGGNLASPLLAEAVGGGAGSTGGAVLLALIAAVAFATILAVVAGLTLTSSASRRARHLQQRDQEGPGHREGGDQGDPDRGRRASALIAILLAIPAQRLNIAFLVALAFAVAASANLPAIVYNMFWRRFNTRGAVWSIYGGLISSVGLVIFSPDHVRQGRRPGQRQEPLAAADQHRHLVVPAGEPRHRVDPARLLPRLARLGHLEGAGAAEDATPSSRSAPSPAPASEKAVQH